LIEGQRPDCNRLDSHPERDAARPSQFLACLSWFPGPLAGFSRRQRRPEEFPWRHALLNPILRRSNQLATPRAHGFLQRRIFRTLHLYGAIGGTLQAAMGLPSSFAPHVRSGKIRALAVSSAKRMAAFPEVPTLMERAVVGVEYESWYGLFAPAGTPRPVIERLHAELGKVVRDKAYGDEKLGKIGLDPFETPSPAAAAAFLRNFYGTLAVVVKKAGIKAD